MFLLSLFTMLLFAQIKPKPFKQGWHCCCFLLFFYQDLETHDAHMCALMQGCFHSLSTKIFSKLYRGFDSMRFTRALKKIKKMNTPLPHQWHNQLWQSLEEGCQRMRFGVPSSLLTSTETVQTSLDREPQNVHQWLSHSS